MLAITREWAQRTTDVRMTRLVKAPPAIGVSVKLLPATEAVATCGLERVAPVSPSFPPSTPPRGAATSRLHTVHAEATRTVARRAHIRARPRAVPLDEVVVVTVGLRLLYILETRPRITPAAP